MLAHLLTATVAVNVYYFYLHECAWAFIKVLVWYDQYVVETSYLNIFGFSQIVHVMFD